MSPVQKVIGSCLSFPDGTRENPIDIDCEDHENSRIHTCGTATNTHMNPTKKIKRQLATKSCPVVIDLTVETSNLPRSCHYQPLNLNAEARKRSVSEMAQGGSFTGLHQDGFALPRAPKGCKPYIKAPLPRFPAARVVYKKNKNGRYFRKRAYGNFPHTVSRSILQASWQTHVSKRIKRPAAVSMSSGREKMRQEMNAEEDLSLSQGDVSKKGSAVPFKLPILESTY